MSRQEEFEDLQDEAVRQGWRLERRANGKLAWIPPDDKTSIFFTMHRVGGGTALRDLRHDLTKRGFKEVSHVARGVTEGNGRAEVVATGPRDPRHDLAGFGEVAVVVADYREERHAEEVYDRPKLASDFSLGIAELVGQEFERLLLNLETQNARLRDENADLRQQLASAKAVTAAEARSIAVAAVEDWLAKR